MFVRDLKKIVDHIENRNYTLKLKVSVPKIRTLNICEGTVVDNKIIFNASTQPGRKAMNMYVLESLLNKAEDNSSILVRDVDLQDMYSVDNYTVTDNSLELIG